MVSHWPDEGDRVFDFVKPDFDDSAWGFPEMPTAGETLAEVRDLNGGTLDCPTHGAQPDDGAPYGAWYARWANGDVQHTLWCGCVFLTGGPE